ncbi:MAG: glycosyltransferase [Devosia sp.]|nr:glycosyltransferase [Devosia sp.]
MTTISSRAAPTVSARSLRVLMALWNGGGNVPPQRALARQLRRAGHDVHVLTHNSLAEAVASDGAFFQTLPSAPQWDSGALCGPDDEIAFIAQHVSGSAAFAEDFLAAYDSLRPDVCVIDAMLITTLDAAIRRSLRCVAVDHLAWSPDGRAQQFMSAMAAQLPARGGNSTFSALLSEMPLTLATSYPEFGTATAAPDIQFVGPIREPVDHQPWPRRFPERPFVLVSLSTNFQHQHGTLQNVCDALGPLPLEVLVTTGRSLRPEQLRLSGGLEARAFVQHDRILPDVDLVVTHAGLGTLMYSAGAGVPCLCLPNGRDQDDNAERVTELGLGRVLPPDAAPTAIGEAVMHMLTDEALHTTCRAFASRVDRFGALERAAKLVEACAQGA